MKHSRLSIPVTAFILIAVSCSDRIPKRPYVDLLFNQREVVTSSDLCDVQGTAIFGDYLFSLRNTGRCVVTNLAEERFISEFALGSNGKRNHANAGFFGKDYYEEGDSFPLLYVSHCTQSPVTEIGLPALDSLVRLCFVERILCDEAGEPCGAELVQVINYEPSAWNSRIWAHDSKNPQWMYCYGNTKGNKVEGNRFIIQKLPLPAFSKDNFIVRMDDSDVIETIYADEVMQEGSRGPQHTILQGAVVVDGIMYIPVGGGSAKNPSELFYIDLNARDKSGKPYRYGYYDYTDVVPCEMEDMDVWRDKLVCTTNDKADLRPVYAFDLKKFKCFLRRK